MFFLEFMDILVYCVYVIGFLIWIFIIVVGLVWVDYVWGCFWGWDFKEMWFLVIWVVYVVYFYVWFIVGWCGCWVVLIVIVGVVCFWFNFVGVNLIFNGFYLYVGI